MRAIFTRENAKHRVTSKHPSLRIDCEWRVIMRESSYHRTLDVRINRYFATAGETTPRVTIGRVKAEITGEHLVSESAPIRRTVRRSSRLSRYLRIVESSSELVLFRNHEVGSDARRFPHRNAPASL